MHSLSVDQLTVQELDRNNEAPKQYGKSISDKPGGKGADKQ